MVAQRRTPSRRTREIPPGLPANAYGTRELDCIFATAVAKEYFGDQALYTIAVVSGFVDVDAITLSTAQLAAAQRLDAGTAWKIILVAALANLAFKAGVVSFLGSAKLFLRILPVFGAGFVAGVAILLAWPG